MRYEAYQRQREQVEPAPQERYQVTSRGLESAYRQVNPDDGLKAPLRRAYPTVSELFKLKQQIADAEASSASVVEQRVLSRQLHAVAEDLRATADFSPQMSSDISTLLGRVNSLAAINHELNVEKPYLAAAETLDKIVANN